MKILLPLLISLISSSVLSQLFVTTPIVTGEILPCQDLQFIDLDTDSDLDMIGASSGILYKIENLGNNLFGQKQLIVSGVDIQEMQLADIDNDGNKDILCALFNEGKIVWYKNFGGGNFGSETIISSSTSLAISVSVIDHDNDGDNDVLSLSRGDQKIAFYENTGSGNFGGQQLLGYASIGSCIRSADIDNDGLQDVVFTAAYNFYGVHCIKNLGGGNFNAFQLDSLYATNYQATLHKDLIIEDIDGDSDIDFVISSNCAGCNIAQLNLLKNDGTGHFTSQIIDGGITNSVNSDRSITIADLDSDGLKDIVSNNATSVVWFRGYGGNNFSAAQPITPIVTNSFPNTIQVTDFDNDNHPDIFVGKSLSIEYINNQSGQTFATTREVEQSAFLTKLIHADINNDGFTDIVSEGYGIAWWESQGNDTLYKHMISSGGGLIDIADFDLDGDLDVVAVQDVGNNNSSPKIFENQSADFSVAHTVNYVLSSDRLFLTDVDGDGMQDFVISGNLGFEIKLLKNNGLYNFSTLSIPLSNYVESFAFDDDQDGDKELFAFSLTGHTLMRFEQSSPWQFDTPDTLVNNSFMGTGSKILSADLNSDGMNDLIVAINSSGSAYWLKNLGAGNYDLTLNNIGYASRISANDIDNDNDLDLVVTYNAGMSWRENLGNDQFAAPVNILSIANATQIADFTVLDLDQDNDLDVVWCAQNVGKINLNKNLTYSNSQVSGRVYIDLNQNGQFDGNESGFPMTSVLAQPLSDFSYSFTDGRYFLIVGDSIGAYTIAPGYVPHWGISSDSLTYTITVDTAFQSMDSLDFGFYPMDSFDFLKTELIGGFPRCNTIINYWLNIKNDGTTIPSGTVHLRLDENINFVSADLAPDSINGQHLYWHYDSLNYFSFQQWNIQVQMPSFLNMGDTLISELTAIVRDVNGDSLVAFADTLSQILVCAYDPNDKVVEPPGYNLPGYIPTGTEWLEYTVRFQNTGNDTAINVVILDQLDPSLIRQSLEPLTYSHPVTIQVDQNGEVRFAFEDIYLPDSTTNEIASHGFIRYRIKIDSNALAGTVIQNTANIYFDYNPAIVTNTTTNTLFDCPESISVSVVPEAICELTDLTLEAMTLNEPVTVHWNLNGLSTNEASFNWTADTIGTFQLHHWLEAPGCSTIDTLYTIEVYDSPEVTLEAFTSDTICAQNEPIQLPFGQPSGGVYSGNGVLGSTFDPATGNGLQTVYYTVTAANSCVASDSTAIFVEDCLSLSEQNNVSITVYPNPFSSSIHLSIPLSEATRYCVSIYTTEGVLVMRNEDLTGQSLTLSLPELASGIYILEVNDSQYGYKKRLIKL